VCETKAKRTFRAFISKSAWHMPIRTPLLRTYTYISIHVNSKEEVIYYRLVSPSRSAHNIFEQTPKLKIPKTKFYRFPSAYYLHVYGITYVLLFFLFFDKVARSVARSFRTQSIYSRPVDKSKNIH